MRKFKDKDYDRAFAEVGTYIETMAIFSDEVSDALHVLEDIVEEVNDRVDAGTMNDEDYEKADEAITEAVTTLLAAAVRDKPGDYNRYGMEA